MRIFISIDLPEEVREEVKKIQDELPNFRENLRFSGPSKFRTAPTRRDTIKNFEVVGKKIEPENLHLTLKFLGEIDERKAEEVRRKLKEIEYNPFETNIDFIGYFDNRNSNRYSQNLIVWLHLTNCKGLQRKVDEALKELFIPEKRFMSHLTIARIKKIADKKRFVEELERLEIPKIKFNVNSFYLKESVLNAQGPKYNVIEEYKLP